MQLRERRVAGVAVLDLYGRLTLTDDPGRLKEKVTTLVSQGHTNIVFNMEGLTYVDSSGLGELVACHTSAWRAGANVKVANAERRLQDLLVLTKLLTVFDCYESVAAALESFVVPA